MSPYSEFVDSALFDVLVWGLAIVVFVGVPLGFILTLAKFFDWIGPALARVPAKIEKVMVAAAQATDEITVQFKSNKGKLAGHAPPTAWDPPEEYLLEYDSEDADDVEYI